MINIIKRAASLFMKTVYHALHHTKHIYLFMFVKCHGTDSLISIPILQISNLSHAKLNDFPKVTQLESSEAIDGVQALPHFFFLKQHYTK